MTFSPFFFYLPKNNFPEKIPLKHASCAFVSFPDKIYFKLATFILAKFLVQKPTPKSTDSEEEAHHEAANYKIWGPLEYGTLVP